MLHPQVAERFHFLTDERYSPTEAASLYDTPATPYVAPGEVLVKDQFVDGRGGKVPVRTYIKRGSQAATPRFLWIHGGGFTEGGLWQIESDMVCRELASRMSIEMIAVDYALCSESVKISSTLGDCIDVFEWLIGPDADSGRDIFVGGNSAGGALAAHLALREVARGLRTVRGVLLTSPILHSEVPPLTPEMTQKLNEIGGFGLTRESVAERVLFISDNEGLELDALPVFAGDATDLAGYPPTFISNSDYDVLRLSGERFAEQLAENKVEVTSETADGTIHSHIGRYPHDFEPAEMTLRSMQRFIEAQLTGKTN